MLRRKFLMNDLNLRSWLTMRDFTQHHNADYYTNSDSYVLDVDLAVRTDVNAFDLVPDLLGNVPGVRGIFDCDLQITKRIGQVLT